MRAMEKNKMLQFARRIVWAFLLALAIATVGSMASRVFEYSKSQSWGQINGKVLSANHGKNKAPRKVKAEIRYEYFVGGKRYEGARYSFFNLVDDSFVETAVGDAIVVYYDEEHPQKSVVRRELAMAQIIRSFIIAVVLGVMAFASMKVFDYLERKS